MTLKEFLKILAANTSAYTWAVNGGYIRGTEKGDTTGFTYCPITAVVQKKAGVLYYPGEHKHAAYEIDLNGRTSRSIVYAADSCENYSPSLRARLLKVCGLTENL